jgi:23S rRNA pseudouridine1911/1915/1917 synthase
MPNKKPFPILFEDDDFLVISKPAGIVVNDAASVAGPTIQSWMTEYLLSLPAVERDAWQQMVPTDFDSQFGSPVDIFMQRKGMVHRLDKDTSGALVLAKHPGSLVNLLAQFRNREVQKEYLCLTHGFFSMFEGEVSGPIGRSSRDRKKFAVVPDGRSALTRYKVEQAYAHFSAHGKEQLGDVFLKKVENSYQGFSLVRCFPKTGRTHQIRVHMAHIKHPLVGDTTYVGRKRAKLDPVWCKRHFLHAASIELQHPRTGEKLRVESPLADDLEQVMELLG